MANDVEILLKAKNEASANLGKVTADTEALAKGLRETASAAQDSAPELEVVADELDALSRQNQVVATLRTLKSELLGSAKALADAKEKTQALALEQKRSSGSNRELNTQLQESRNRVKQLAATQTRQLDAYKQLKKEAQGYGLNLKNLSSSQNALSSAINATTQRAKSLQASLNKTSRSARTVGDDIKDVGNKSEAAATGIGKVVRRLTAFVATAFTLNKVKQGLDAILATGGEFETFETQLEGLFDTVEEAEGAFDWVEDFTENAPLQLNETLDAFVKLKNFGLDPMEGALQAIVDQNAKLGGGQERLNGIILAVGQAWAKQKLQAEEVLQLVERGVPVYELLEKALGKNSAELQKMGENGELGRDAIAALIDEMGNASFGQAQKEMQNWNGLVSNARDQVDQFLNRIADAGVLDYFKRQLDSIIKTTKQMANDGRLQKYAEQISDFMVGAAEATKSFFKTIYDLRGELKLLATAFVAVKVGSLVKGFISMGAAAVTAAKGVKNLSAVIAGTGWGAVALGIGYVGTKLYELYDASKIAERGQADLALKQQELDQVYQNLSDRLGIQIENAKDLIAAENAGLIVFDKKTERYELAAQKLETLTEQQREYISSTAGLSDEIDSEAEALANAGLKAQAFIEQLHAMQAETDGLSDALGKLSDTDFSQFANELAAAIDNGYVSGADKVAASNAMLEESLNRLNLSAEQLKTGLTDTERVAVASFNTIARQADISSANVLTVFEAALNDIDTTGGLDALTASLKELGDQGKLSADDLNDALTQINEKTIELNAGLTQTSQIALTEFKKISQQAKVTGADISEALDDALDVVDSKRAIRLLEDELNRLHQSGVLSLSELEQEMEKLEKRISEVGDAAEVSKQKLDALLSDIDSAKTVDSLDRVGEAAAQAWDDGLISAERYLDVMTRIDEQKDALIEKTEEQIQKEHELNEVAGANVGQQVADSEKLIKNKKILIAGTKRENELSKKARDLLLENNKNRKLYGLRAYLNYLRDVESVTEKMVNASEAADTMASNAVRAANRMGDARGLRSYQSQLESAIKNSEKLDSTSLSNLQNALAAVNARMQQVQQTTKNATSQFTSMQQELAGLQGDEREIQRLRFAERRAEIVAKIAEAQSQGNKEAEEQLRGSLVLLQRINRERVRQINKNQQAEQAKQVQSGVQQTPAKTVVLKLENDNGQTAEVSTTDRDADNIVSMLSSAKGVSAS